MMHENQTGIALPIPYIAPTLQGLDVLRLAKTGVVYYNNTIPSFVERDRVDAIVGTIKIKECICNAARVFCEQHDITKNTIGIHLRKTDFGNQVNEGKALAFITSNPGKVFFVCSDDKNTEDKFRVNKNVVVFYKTAYVEKLMAGEWDADTIDASGRRFPFNVNRSRASVIEGFIDMLILSRTTPHFETTSSFLRFAKIFGRSQNAFNARHPS